MSIVQDRLKRRLEEKKQLQEHVNTTNAPITDVQQAQIDEITKSISEENFQTISANGVDAATDQLIKSAHDKVEALDISETEKLRLEKNIAANIAGLGPLEQFMNDPDITEIMVLRYDHIVIEKNGQKINTDVQFTSEQHLLNVIQRIIQPLGKQLTLAIPIVDARLKDGSRVNATITPISVDGATLTIRRFSTKALTGDDYVRLGTMSQKMLDFLITAVKGKANIIVSGGTNTGKTTLLNMLSNYIPEDEMIVTIEDSCELQLHTPNLRRLEARGTVGTANNAMVVDITALVKNSLRMNPDRIIVGEIRDGTIVDMISAMSTGHEGSMSTTHANSPENLVNSRIPIFYSMSHTSFSAETQALQIAEALDLIVQIGFRHGKRVITQITEVCGATGQKVNLKDIFEYNSNDEFLFTNHIPERLIKKLKANGILLDMSVFM